MESMGFWRAIKGQKFASECRLRRLVGCLIFGPFGPCKRTSQILIKPFPLLLKCGPAPGKFLHWSNWGNVKILVIRVIRAKRESFFCPYLSVLAPWNALAVLFHWGLSVAYVSCFLSFQLSALSFSGLSRLFCLSGSFEL